VQIEFFDLRGREPLDLAAFVAGLGLATDEACAEGDGELLPDLAVVVGHDVTGVGVGAGDRFDCDVVAGLFFDLADDGFGDGLAGFVASAG
jgi:hypothetical protein